MTVSVIMSSKNATYNSNFSDRCPGCYFYKKVPGSDFCCITCRDFPGTNSHGHSFSTHVAEKWDTVPPAGTIFFYESSSPYYYLTNFYLCVMKVGGVLYKSSEHYFQAAKFFTTRPDIAQLIANARTPREAFDLAHIYNIYVREDWRAVKDDVMLHILREKFRQNPDLAKRLRNTGSSKLVEHTSKDSYWADGGDGSGKNMLGQLLMVVRSEI